MISFKPLRTISLHLVAIALHSVNFTYLYFTDHKGLMNFHKKPLALSGGKLQPVPRKSETASDHNHGRLKSTVPVSGRGLPKMETGTTSSTQMAVTSSRAGKRLVPWQFRSAFDFDWSRVFFSWRARSFCNCCSCLILCASHLDCFQFIMMGTNIVLTVFFASHLSHVCRGASDNWRRPLVLLPLLCTMGW